MLSYIAVLSQGRSDAMAISRAAKWVTIGEYPGAGDGHAVQRTDVVEHGASVAVALRIVHVGAYVYALRRVADAGTNSHGDVIYAKWTLTINHR